MILTFPIQLFYCWSDGLDQLVVRDITGFHGTEQQGTRKWSTVAKDEHVIEMG